MCVMSLAATFIFLFLQGTAAQDQALKLRVDEQMPTIEESLRRHNIQLTRAALVNALRNADPDVRFLAAAKLAQDKATETVPAMLDALKAETVERTRVNIAYSLAQLDEERGFIALRDTCRDPSNRHWNRLLAARYLVAYMKRKDDACKTALLEILQSRPDSDSFVEAVSLLREFHDLSENETQTIFEVATISLVATSPSLRLAASRTLGELGNCSAIPYLQSAAAKERDEAVRAQMQADLERLQPKQKPKQKQ